MDTFDSGRLINQPSYDYEKASIWSNVGDRQFIGTIDPQNTNDLLQRIKNKGLSQADKDVVINGLKKLYREKVLPLEMATGYARFVSAPMSPSEFDSKPIVLVLGQYSVGKTSFIRSLLQQDVPGQRIGPEPTTDRFTAIMHTTPGQASDRQIPGHALVMQSDKPFSGLSKLGSSFLSRFEGVEVSAPILQDITLVDTPGVLAGEKQRIGREYNFTEVVEWFAQRADLVLVMFDAHKLDVSDELRAVLDCLKPHQGKVRVLLNKADAVDGKELLRVYGSLMWSLARVVPTPEACRVYLGSFWDAPLKVEDNRALLEREKADLVQEMQGLSSGEVIRRINELTKRASSVKMHAYILHYLRKQIPYNPLARPDKQRRLLERLKSEFLACAHRYGLAEGDIPPVDRYYDKLRAIRDISRLNRLDKGLVAEMDRAIGEDLPRLLQLATRAGADGDTAGGVSAGSEPTVPFQPPPFSPPPAYDPPSLANCGTFPSYHQGPLSSKNGVDRLQVPPLSQQGQNFVTDDPLLAAQQQWHRDNNGY